MCIQFNIGQFCSLIPIYFHWVTEKFLESVTRANFYLTPYSIYITHRSRHRCTLIAHWCARHFWTGVTLINFRLTQTHLIVLNSVITIVYIHRGKKCEWFHFYQWLVLKHFLSDARKNQSIIFALSASKFYGFSPCKPRAKEIVFAERNLFRFRFNSSNKKTNQTNKQTWKTIPQAWIFRWMADIAWYYDGPSKEVISNLSTLHILLLCCVLLVLFSSFSPFQKQIACRMLYFQRKFWLPKQFYHNSRKVWTCKPSAAIAAAYSIASHRICCCCCIIIYGAIFNSWNVRRHIQIAGRVNLIWKQSSQPRY